MEKGNMLNKCEVCDAENSNDRVRCWKCDEVLPFKRVEGTQPFPEPQLPPEPEFKSRLQRPRFSFARRASGFMKKEMRWIILLSVVVIIVILLATFGPQRPNSPSSQPTPVPTIGQNGIGVTSIDGEDIGISDGSYALDTNRVAGPLMIQASEDFRKGNVGPAMAEWNDAYEKDTSDAEPLIYRENQRASGSPHITIVLGVLLGVKVPDGFSRDHLQGAYIVQKECNDNPQLCGGKMLRFLIARSGSHPENVQMIAQQIVQAGKYDKTIVGVQGWPTSVATLNVVSILAAAHLPVIASNTTTDDLTGVSTYFFRLVAPNIQQIPLITTYVEKNIAPQRLVVFEDPKEPYSQSLASDFSRQFTKDGYKIVSTENFTTGTDPQLAQHVRNVLTTYKPDFLFFPTNTVGDIKTVLKTVESTPGYANLKVFTGGAGYELVQDGGVITGYEHMLLTASAYPDEWSILDPNDPLPSFFGEYPAAYDPSNQHIDTPPYYGFRRTDAEVMLTFDAIRVILAASKIAIQQGKQNPTSEDIRNALSQINDSQPFQGISGAISFDSHGNPTNKLHFILRVDGELHLHAVAYQGCLLVNPTCDTSPHSLE